MGIVRRLGLGVLASLVFVSCSEARDAGDDVTSTPSVTTEGALFEDPRLRLDGIGPISVGMSLEEATAAVGRKVVIEPNSLLQAEESLCGSASVEDGPDDLSLMVLRGDVQAEWRIHRIDVVGDDIATVEGIRVGTTEASVKQAYGDDLAVEPHHYTGPKGHYLVHNPDGEGGQMLLFETDGNKVLVFRSGNDEAVRYVEGCA